MPQRVIGFNVKDPSRLDAGRPSSAAEELILLSVGKNLLNCGIDRQRDET